MELPDRDSGRPRPLQGHPRAFAFGSHDTVKTRIYLETIYAFNSHELLLRNSMPFPAYGNSYPAASLAPPQLKHQRGSISVFGEKHFQ